MAGVVKGRTYEETDLMRESRAEGDVIAEIAAEELEAYLGNHLACQRRLLNVAFALNIAPIYRQPSCLPDSIA